jgi:hypothetical protein
VVITGSTASTGDLLAAAADGRLTLPGDPPTAPAGLDLAQFQTAGQSALVVGDAESFTQTGSDRSPMVRGTRYVDGSSRGSLTWSAAPRYSGATFTCLKSYRFCDTVTYGDVTVQVAGLKKKAGGGWMVEYDGPSYAVRVWSADKSMPKKRAYAFVTQSLWQP